MNKIRLAILCHFSNSLIRKQLLLFPAGTRYFYKDFANWITNIISGLKDKDEIELHVISPHIGMKKEVQEFEVEGVHYYFFRTELPPPWRYIENRFYPQSRRDFPRNRRIIRSIVSKINPDMVNLIGAENAYYSIAALDIRNIPVMIHLQTVYSNPDRVKNAGSVDMKRWNTELQLFHKTPYIALTGRRYYDLVKGYEPNAIIFPRYWPLAKFPAIPDVEKKYDFVFFARYLNKNKGFDNAIEGMNMFLKTYPNARFLAIGGYDADWPLFEKRIKELSLSDSLEIHESFESYEDLLKYVRQARFALLPITMDVLSGTILEAMRMRMPVVTCKTSGTPSLNEKRKTVLISEIGDHKGLAENMRRLFEDDELQATLVQNASLYLQEMDDTNAHNVDVMIEQYKAVISHYNDGTPIPEQLLFNPEAV